MDVQQIVKSFRNTMKIMYLIFGYVQIFYNIVRQKFTKSQIKNK